MNRQLSAAELERKLVRLKARNLDGMGFEARQRHQMRLRTLEGLHHQALHREAFEQTRRSCEDAPAESC